jgi:hypothetical protein
MNNILDVLEPAQKAFDGEGEFGLFFDDGVHSGHASAALSLNRKDIQFTLSGPQEIVEFMSVIMGEVQPLAFCTLMPAEGVTVPGYVNLRILHIGRFMIHFNDAELARFRQFLKSKLTGIRLP